MAASEQTPNVLTMPDNVWSGGVLLGSMMALRAGTRAVDLTRKRTQVPIELDELPAQATQRLDLVR